MRKIQSFLCILFVLCFVSFSQAAIVLDQSNTSIYSAMVGTSHYQQSITDGVTGILNAINLWANAGNINLRITKGVPVQTGGWLYNQTVSLAGGWNYIDVSGANINLTAGDVFVLDWNGTTGSPNFAISTYTGAAYPSGDLWKVTGSSGTTSIYGGTWDMVFQTFVNQPDPPAATPEPTTMLLMGIGLAGTAFMRKRNKHVLHR